MHQSTCTRPRARAAETPATVAVWAPCADSIVRHVTVAAAAFLSAHVADADLTLGVPLAVELPKVELPKVELPKVELPKVDLPKVGLPKLKVPELKLPSLGKKGAEKPAAKTEKPRLNVTVRAGTGVTGAGAAASAPTLDELTGVKKDVVISSGEGWKRFPSRRMPGANMAGWKEVAKEIGPKI